MNHLTEFVIGDWFDKGHCLTKIIKVKSNKNKIEIKEAYNKGTKKIGFNLTQNVCCKYKDTIILPKYIKLLQKHNIDISSFKYMNQALKNVYLTIDEYLYLYLQICKLTDINFHYIIEPLDPIDIGGYGLFQ